LTCRNPRQLWIAISKTNNIILGSYKIGDAFTNAINQKPTGLACVGPESTNFVPIPDTAFEENFRVGDITFYHSNNGKLDSNFVDSSIG
jgi:hypothetical protein